MINFISEMGTTMIIWVIHKIWTINLRHQQGLAWKIMRAWSTSYSHWWKVFQFKSNISILIILYTYINISTDLSQNNNSTLFPIIPTARTLQRSSLASSAKSIDVIREEEVNNVKGTISKIKKVFQLFYLKISGWRRRRCAHRTSQEDDNDKAENLQKYVFIKLLHFYPAMFIIQVKRRPTVQSSCRRFCGGGFLWLFVFSSPFLVCFYNCFPVALWVNCPILDAPLKTSLFWKIKKQVSMHLSYSGK